MLAREPKTTDWTEDRGLAAQIASELEKVLERPAEFTECIRRYAADTWEVTSTPMKPEVDGLGSSDLWITCKRELELRDHSEEEAHRILKERNCFHAGNAVIVRETVFLSPGTDQMLEHHRGLVLFVYNGQITGCIDAEDELPEQLGAPRREIRQSVAKTYAEPVKDKLWPYYFGLDPQISQKQDEETAKKFAAKLSEYYVHPDENDRFMRENTAENTFTLHYPPIPGREGYGPRETWLDIEYSTRKISLNNTTQNRYLKHENFSAVGNFIFLDEDRIYPTPDGSLFYMHCLATVFVYNGQLTGFYAFTDSYPEHIAREKAKLFNSIIEEEQESPLDSSMIAYL